MKLEGKVIIDKEGHRLIILTDSPGFWYVDNIIHRAKLISNVTILPAEIILTIPDSDDGKETLAEKRERQIAEYDPIADEEAQQRADLDDGGG